MNLMTKAEFTIGSKEKHTITVEATNTFVRRLKVVIDGKEVVKTLWSKYSGISPNFSVGDKEKHQIEVKVNGYFVPKITLLVDGKLADST